MINQNKNDNAANRKSYVGSIYNKGEKDRKQSVLNSLNPKWKALHELGYIHIHDLDAYGLTYNCLTFDILNAFPYKRFKNLTLEEKILGLFDFIKELICEVGNEQSGGMSFPNFDKEISAILVKLGIKLGSHDSLIKANIKSMIVWFNNLHTRMGQTSYYVTLNLGLGIDGYSRFITESVLDSFYELGDTIYKPNIVFKVKEGINRKSSDKNYDLLLKALNCTSKKMIPTYLLCDCEMDKIFDPEKLSIMGCRTRVADDIFGKNGAIGRSNIDNTTINLPRLALEINEEMTSSTSLQKYKEFKKRWLAVAELVKDQLLDRYSRTCQSDINLFPTNRKYKLMCEDINEVGLEGQFKHGTLSIGFIGLSEAMEVLFDKKFWADSKTYEYALDFITFMRNYCDDCKQKYNLNFSLLATSGELISGRFCEIDSKKFHNPILDKGYYTNSFHVDVDSNLPAYKKIQLEGKFHKYSNGGCITYVELKEAPLSNAEGLDELVEIAIKSGVHYLGFNFPKDICNDCHCSGTFDVCPICGSKNITRIRRVSGYLEIQDYFTEGKKHESKNRRAN